MDFLSLPIYALFNAAAIGTFVRLSQSEARRLDQPGEPLLDSLLYLIPVAMIGARLGYVGLHLEYFFEHPFRAIQFWKGGLRFYGGFFSALAALAILSNKRAFLFWKTADLFTPGLVLGHSIGRLGCYISHCRFDHPALQTPWWESDPGARQIASQTATSGQLYQALANLAIFCLLWILRRKKGFDGQLILSYIFLYALADSLIHTALGQIQPPFYWGIVTQYQLLSGLLALGAFAAMFGLSGRKRS